MIQYKIEYVLVIVFILALLTACAPSKEEVQYDMILRKIGKHCNDANGDAASPVTKGQWLNYILVRPFLFQCTRTEILFGYTKVVTLHIYRIRKNSEGNLEVEIR